MKRTAYTPVTNTRGIELGEATENERGYFPRPTLGTFRTWDEAAARARELNTAAGLTEKDALDIVASSMRDDAPRPSIMEGEEGRELADEQRDGLRELLRLCGLRRVAEALADAAEDANEDSAAEWLRALAQERQPRRARL